MPEYLALLRAINIGAHNPIRMTTLKEIFTSQGAVRVRTYLQSGNVVFQCEPEDVSGIVEGVEASLVELLGSGVPITTRPLTLVQGCVEGNPYSAVEVRADDQEYVTFLYKDPPNPITLPLTSKRGDIVVFGLRDREVFSISRRVGGKYGFPNAFIEREFGVVATSRKWSTVERLVSKYGNA